MAVEREIAYAGKDRAEMKHQFRGTVDVIPVFKIMDREELEIRDRWLKITHRNINNSFVLGHPVNGILGSGTIGDFRGDPILDRVVQAENIYREWFYDDEFKTTAETTANWDITNHQITFSSGDIAQSTSIYYNVTNITGVRLTAEYSGTISFYLSNDGGTTWEAVVPGELHTFSTTGQDLRWKASAQTSATLNYLNIEIIT